MKRIRGALAAAVALLLLLAGCGGVAPGEDADARRTAGPGLEPLDPPATVRIAEDGSPSGAGFYIATERGYFAELGLEPEYVTFESSAYMLPAVAAGQVDVAGGIMTASFLNAVDRGLDVKIVADKGRNVPGASYFDLVVASDVADEMRTLEDLKGRRIAITSRGSIDHLFADLALQAAGLTEGEAEYVVIRDFGQINPALANGSVEAAMHIEPLITRGESEGVLHRWIDATAFARDFQVAVVLSSPRFLGERRRVAERFMLAYLRGLRDYNAAFKRDQDLAEIIEIMAAYTPMKDRDLWRRVNVVGLDPDGRVIVESIDEQIAWFRDKGLYEGELTAADLVDASLVDSALGRLGGGGE